MSIQIGSRTNTVTSKERIFLQSATESNLIILQSATPATQIIFDNSYILGRTDTAFALTTADGALLTSTLPTQTSIFTSTRIYSNLTVDSNAVFQGQLSSSNIATGKLAIADTTNNPATTLLGIRNFANQDKLTLNALGIASLTGSLGIGTAAPQEALHVLNNAIVGGTLTASNLAARYIRSPDNTKVVINSDTEVVGSFVVRGAFDPGVLNVRDRVDTPFLHIFSSNAAPSNIIQADLNYWGVCNATPLVVDVSGRVGLGTTIPQSIIDIRESEINSAYSALCNIVNITGSNNTLLAVNQNAQLGIGTTSPIYSIHIQCADAVDPTIPAIGICAGSTPTTLIGTRVAIGRDHINADYYLDVAETSRFSQLEASGIVGPDDNDKVISFSNSLLRDIESVTTCNIATNTATMEHLITNYMFTSNWEIIGMQCFNSNTRGLSQFHILTSNLLFTGRQAFIDETLSEEYIYSGVEDPTVTGKLKVRANAREDGATSRGIVVLGSGSTSIQVTSAQTPSYELTNSTTTVMMGLNPITNNFYIQRYGSTTQNIQILPTDAIRLSGDNIRITKDGFMGVRTYTDPVVPVEIAGTTHIRNEVGGNTVLYVKANNTNQSVGIGTTDIQATLHVAGSLYARDASRINSDLTVAGNLSFNGSLIQNGAPYIGSQWTSGTGNTIYYTAGNVGIGTSAASSRLTVSGPMRVDGVITTTSSVVSTSDKKVKTDLQRILGATAMIASLTGYRYTRTETGMREVGLIAQEVQRVLPEAVFETATGELALAYGNLAGLWVEAFKELNDRVSALEALINK